MSAVALLSFLCLSLVFSCGGTSTPADVDGGTSKDAAPPSIDAAEDLGASCGLGCVGTTTCASINSDCSSQICTFDGSEAYCSQDCSSTTCPAGYTCEDTAGIQGAPNRVCWKDGIPVEMGNVQLDLEIELVWNGQDILIELDQAIPILDPSQDLECNGAYELQGTAYPSYFRRWDTLKPCFEVAPELRDAQLNVQIPIPADAGAADFPNMRWRLEGNFSSSDSDANNYWQYTSNLSVHVLSVDRSNDVVTTTMMVDDSAALSFCGAPDDLGSCDLFGASATIRGSAVWRTQDSP